MKMKSRRWAVALASVTAMAAVSGIGATGAQAALAGHCGGSNIQGQGSSLQNAAQTIWTLGVGGTTTGFNTNSAANGGCTLGGSPLKPTVRYTSSSSGACLNGFGAGGAAGFTTTFAYCGTDDAPSTAQLTSIGTTTGAKALTIPVAQAAIAVVVNPPAGCAITAITPATLESTFRGAAATTTWASIGGTGTSCANNITRVVRNDVSGTTYQFKHYLTTQNSSPVTGGLSWADLQGGSNSTVWPGAVTRSQSGCATAMSLNCSGGVNSGSGGGDEVRTVGATGGSIGYAALSDARAVTTAIGGTDATLKWVKLTTALGNLDPSTNNLSTVKQRSNCPTGAGSYASPTGGATGDWSGVYVSSTAGNYPICTLTWDLAVNDYTPVFGGGVSATGGTIGRGVLDYLHYVLLGGQTDALGSPAAADYAALPTDVKEIATTGVQTIGAS